MKLLDMCKNYIVFTDDYKNEDTFLDKYIFDISYRYCQENIRGGIGIEIYNNDNNKYELIAYIDLKNRNFMELEDIYKSIKAVSLTGITIEDVEKQENNKNVLLNTINIYYRRILDRRPDLWVEVEEDIYNSNEKFVIKGYEDLRKNWIIRSRIRTLNIEKVNKYIEELENKIEILKKENQNILNMLKEILKRKEM